MVHHQCLELLLVALFRLHQLLGKRLTLPVNVLRALHANQTKLAALPVPPGLDPSLANIVRHSIADSFICGFRVVMLSCAALSLASAVIARLMITDKMITDKAS